MKRSKMGAIGGSGFGVRSNLNGLHSQFPEILWVFVGFLVFVLFIYSYAVSEEESSLFFIQDRTVQEFGRGSQILNFESRWTGACPEGQTLYTFTVAPKNGKPFSASACCVSGDCFIR